MIKPSCIVIRFTAILILFLSATFIIYAQTATIRGFVYDKDNLEPIMFSNVYLKGTTFGSATDVNGFFSITRITPGEYLLISTYIGYDTLETRVKVGAGEILTEKVYISKKAVQLETFNISAEKQEARTEVKISVSKITPKELKQLPTIGGEPDIAQYLQILPGVVFTGDQGGQLYIRGGSPIQNKVLLDGMIIYNPFHSIGLFSVFDNDIIRTADVYTGGFNAEYGGRISSIMDFKTRDGNKLRYGGKIQSSPFTSKLMLEGPIKKAKLDGKGHSSFVLSAKNSYLDKTSTTLYNYIDTGGLPYSFTDLYGKITLNADNGSKVSFFGFRFSDQVKYRQVSDLNWKSSGFGTNFVLIPGSSPVLIDGSFAYSQYGITLSESDNKPRNSSINGFNMGLNFTYFFKEDELKYGIELLGFQTDFNFFNYVGRKIDQVESTTEIAGFLKYKKLLGKLVIEPSLRTNYYASLSEFSTEPRLGAKYNITKKWRAKFAGGFYTQNLISATSDRDVVSLFYGFLAGPDNLQSKFNGKDVVSRLQKAIHGVGGFEIDLPKHFDLNIEAYIKEFTQLTNLNRDKLYDDIASNSAIPDYQKKDFVIENGTAQGVDILLKYDYRRLYLWFVYSLGYVSRFDGRREYAPHFDRRHNINLVGSYTFGKNLDWEFNTRWNFGSGLPFTKTQGFYEFVDFSQGLSTNYTTVNGQLGILYGDLNTGILPYYHRMDIALKKSFVISKNSILEANASVINVYDRKNIFYFDRIRYERVNQLPVLPTAGVSLTF
jgi:hypothetical protein